jgi:hypothetical protein
LVNSLDSRTRMPEPVWLGEAAMRRNEVMRARGRAVLPPAEHQEKLTFGDSREFAHGS